MGKKDYSGFFKFPQQLYGRERQIAALMAGFERVSQGSVQLALVSGYSGSGKSMVVQELIKPITKHRGYFITGKFDQFQRDTPYYSLIQAFRELVKQILTESRSQIADWREKLLDQLGMNGQILIDLIPEIEHVIGAQPTAPQLEAEQNRNRFNMILGNFIQVFAKTEHPLVIFLDDLQWADSASIQLLKRLVTSNQIESLYLIGAYRNNEVTAGHPLAVVIEEIKSERGNVHQVEVQALTLEDTIHLLMDALHMSSRAVVSLAQLIMQRTDGNPFFLRTFLTNLVADNLVKFDHANHTWAWDIAQIQQQETADNVVDLMLDRMQRLSPKVRQALQVAACIGDRFTLQLLSQLQNSKVDATFREMEEAIIRGFVIPLSPLVRPVDEMVVNVTYKFAHDRIRQAIYQSVSAVEKRQNHHQISQVLIAQSDQSTQEEYLFEIVNHLNASLNEEARQNHLQLAQWNLRAGRKAQIAAAFESALVYYRTGVRSLPPKHWQAHYQLTFDLYKGLVEATYLSGQSDQTYHYADIALKKATSNLDKVSIYLSLIRTYQNKTQQTKAIDTALEALTLLDVHCPQPATKADEEQAWQEIYATLKTMTIDDLAALPTTGRPEVVMAVEVLSQVISVAWDVNPHLYVVLAMKRISLMLTYGNMPASAAAYAAYGLNLCQRGEIERGYQFGVLAERLQKRYDVLAYEARTITNIHVFIYHWKDHLAKSLPALQRGYHSGLQSGDIEFSSACALGYIRYGLFSGLGLEQLKVELSAYASQMKRFNQQIHYLLTAVMWQLVINLTEDTNDPTQLVGQAYDEVTIHKVGNRSVSLDLNRHYYLYKLMLYYLFCQYDRAYAWITNDDHRPQVLYRSQSDDVCLTFFTTLTQLTQIPTASNSKRLSLQSAIEQNLQQLEVWANRAPMNYRHKYHLVKAEYLRVYGQSDQARAYYEKAIDGAKENNFVHEEAIARELTGNFYASINQMALANFFMQGAYKGYAKWGAVAKCNHLLQQYSTWFEHPDLASNHVDYRRTTLTQPVLFINSSPAIGMQQLDFDSIVKALQTISGEIILDRLIETMMQIVMENAGAQHGFLMLNRSDEWYIEAKIDMGIEQGSFEPLLLESAASLCPLSLIHYIQHTQTTVILNNATIDPQFRADPYIVETAVKSAVGLPLINRGELIGVIYLENNLNTDVFSSQRLAVLNLLSSQMAISLNNALLYDHLEERVTQRTQALTGTLDELKETQIALIAANQKAEQASLSKSVFISQMTHELRTPMNGVLGMATLLSDTDLTPQQYSMLNTIQSSGDTLLTIINDILDFSKIEANKLDLERLPFDLKSCIEDTFDLIRPTASEKGLYLNYIITDNVPLGLIQDVTRLRQILTNLVGNAVKFTDTGGISITVEAEPIATKQYRIAFAVQDSGIGIPTDRIHHLFTSFSQVDASTTREYGGTGLGLAISKQLSELMGGTMWVESEFGVGSTFHFTIVAQATKLETKQIDDQTTIFDQTLAERKPHRILLAEDNMINQTVTLSFLKKLGYQADVAANGLEVLEALKRQSYNLILMDIHMPEMDGLTTTKHIRQAWPTDQQPTIIALTADAMAQQRAAYLAEGMDAFLSKPLRISELKAALEQTPVAPTVAKQTTQLSPPSNNSSDSLTLPPAIVPANDKDLATQLSYRILLAEDNPINQAIAKSLLETLDCSVTVVHNGKEALAALQNQTFDVILMDTRMPVMDGLTAARQIRETLPSNQQPYIVAFTAEDIDAHKDRYLAAGVDDFLGKPLRKPDLIAVLKHCRA
ncbi:MAG: response regulator [Chloroflexota bacterium]